MPASRRRTDVQQLPLGWRWPAQQRFETFFVGVNDATVDLLERVAAGSETAWVFLHGPEGSGRTHLAMAVCQAASAAGFSAQYLPLAALAVAQEGAIRGFGGSDLLVLDDVGAIAGIAAAEHALFDLYNRCRAEGSTLVFVADAPPAQLGIVLPDLVSRLSSCTQAPLRPLDDGQRRQVLRERAEARGIALDEAVLDFLFTHYARDLGSLGALLDQVDRASLAAKRRVTVPFLRQLLREQRAGAADET
ncbi:MAG: DnaA regulatory inactivator Hda [Lysobacterales bacterium 69-70]|nr:DnaA regulatory inactivator Hda [Xanthomonadaceae bacterium]ODU36114.1 MAG: DnaA regulatory inactivator Hda [Xanthomonadaceae bacterium SCN 69-320]ODV18142.1 MAG: DnaA regulatory inactivator Hda [Xanthomonadaceae bacterium SCN 69-25]OJY99426.1 MAG: DnaA regulatory inactivator Hda [Xanthomonadales bacterium 69-70]